MPTLTLPTSEQNANVISQGLAACMPEGEARMAGCCPFDPRWFPQWSAATDASM